MGDLNGCVVTSSRLIYAIAYLDYSCISLSAELGRVLNEKNHLKLDLEFRPQIEPSFKLGWRRVGAG